MLAGCSFYPLPQLLMGGSSLLQIKAQRTLAVDALRTSRAIVAGYMVLGMLVKVITSTIKVGECGPRFLAIGPLLMLGCRRGV